MNPFCYTVFYPKDCSQVRGSGSTMFYEKCFRVCFQLLSSKCFHFHIPVYNKFIRPLSIQSLQSLNVFVYFHNFSLHHSFTPQCSPDHLSWDSIKGFFQVNKCHAEFFPAISYFSFICLTIKLASFIPFPGINPICISSSFTNE